MPPMDAVQGTMVIENMTLSSVDPEDDVTINDVLVLNGINTEEELQDSIGPVFVSDGEGTYKTFTLNLDGAGTLVLENVINGTST